MANIRISPAAVIGGKRNIAMSGKERRSAIRSIARVVDTTSKEAVIQQDDREGSLSNRYLHHARNRQPVAGIVDQIRSIKFAFIQRFTNVNITASKIMLAKPIYRKRKDQLFCCRRRRGSQGQGWNRRGR